MNDITIFTITFCGCLLLCSFGGLAIGFEIGYRMAQKEHEYKEKTTSDE